MGGTDTIGWIGAGRMGSAMATRLLKHGCDVAVYNRTSSKLESLVALGAKPVEAVSELAARRIVFVTVASSEDLLGVLDGDGGLLSQDEAPEIVVDCSTVSLEARSRALARRRAVDDVAGGSGQRQRKGGQSRTAHHGSLWSAGGFRRRPPVPRAN